MKNTDTSAEQNNQKLWDEIAPVHLKAYREVAMLKAGKTVLDEIELRELGDVTGKSMLHLQCHIGTDTLSWVRQGATVTGVDFSAESIACARQLQAELKLDATFIQSNVYELPNVLQGSFDIVYTSRGVLCWLRDLDRWGQIVSHFLKPGGIFYIMESHPLCYILDENPPGNLTVTHPYFHRDEPSVWDDDGPDYADENYHPRNPSHEWTWALSDIVNALIKAGMHLELLNEYDRIFFKAFPGMIEHSDRWYHFKQHAGKFPLIFTLRAKKPEARR